MKLWDCLFVLNSRLEMNLKVMFLSHSPVNTQFICSDWIGINNKNIYVIGGESLSLASALIEFKK